MYVGCYFILALCRCYSCNIPFHPLQFSFNLKIITLQQIFHSVGCAMYLGYVSDLRHLKAMLFPHFGTHRLVKSGQFGFMAIISTVVGSDFPKTHN